MFKNCLCFLMIGLPAISFSLPNLCANDFFEISADGKSVKATPKTQDFLKVAQVGKQFNFTQSGARVLIPDFVQNSVPRTMFLDSQGRIFQIKMVDDTIYHLAYQKGRCFVQQSNWTIKHREDVRKSQMCKELQDVLKTFETCATDADQKIKSIYRKHRVSNKNEIDLEKNTEFEGPVVAAIKRVADCMREPLISKSYLDKDLWESVATNNSKAADAFVK